jgi:cAMP-specific phosphodiesterase 4
MDENDLDKVMDWNLKFFDMDIEEKYRMVWFMFHSLNYIEKFEIDLEIFGRFIGVLQEKYNCRDNPFYNFEHGLTGLCLNLSFSCLIFF